MEINEVLKQFAEASGLCINFSKSSLIFSSNSPLHLRTRIANLLGIDRVDHPDKFLGLPF